MGIDLSAETACRECRHASRHLRIIERTFGFRESSLLPGRALKPVCVNRENGGHLIKAGCWREIAPRDHPRRWIGDRARAHRPRRAVNIIDINNAAVDRRR